MAGLLIRAQARANLDFPPLCPDTQRVHSRSRRDGAAHGRGAGVTDSSFEIETFV
jgi:hypothetical protein